MSNPTPRRKRKVKVNVDLVKAALQERKRINSPDLRDLEFYLDGKKVNVPADVLEDFSFIGLNNIDFIQTYFLKSKHVRVLTLTRRRVVAPAKCGKRFWASTLDSSVSDICTKDKGHQGPCAAIGESK
jgi:hypothetical protein